MKISLQNIDSVCFKKRNLKKKGKYLISYNFLITNLFPRLIPVQAP